jgi:hypothetical protein
MVEPRHKIPFTPWRVGFEAEKPIKRFLRSRNVVTLIGMAGLVLAVAALLVVVGIGETQIVASEDAGGHAANLFLNGWFDVGLFLAGLGILIGTVAISANSSQASARREFPDAEIRIMWRAFADMAAPVAPDGRERRVRLVYMHLLVTNRERSRTASLYFNGTWCLKPGTLVIPGSVVDAESGKPFMVFPPARWEPDIRLFRPYPGPQLDSARPLELPLHVPPERTAEGDIFFEIEEGQTSVLDGSAEPALEAVDMHSGKWVFFNRAYPDES